MPSALITQVLPDTLSGILFTALLLLVTYQLATYAYNAFFHPLRRFPGPFLSKISNFPLIVQSLRGDSLSWTIELHEKHGEVVRTGPHELSFSAADAYRDIYGHRKSGLPTLQKDPKFYASQTGDVDDIFNSNSEGHARQHRVFAHAFSEKALKAQETLFLGYADQLVENLRRTPARQKIDIVRKYNFATFDIMGDLTFGESLGMLSTSEYHPWVSTIMAYVRFGTYVRCIRYFPLLEQLLLKYCIPSSFKAKMDLHNEFCVQRVNSRLEQNDDRSDIWGLVLRQSENHGLTKQEMYANAHIFMSAGTETTTTALSGLTFLLLKNPTKLDKLKRELRTSFETYQDISMEKMQALPYLNACVEEALRVYPPIAIGLPRITPKGMSTKIAGHEVPPGTRVYVTNLAALRNPRNWHDAYAFVPERWLPESRDSETYAGEKRHAFHPFSTGPRACIGKSMAYHEIRLLCTKLLYNFDITLDPESANWTDQKNYILWDKPPLFCHLQPVAATN